MPDKLMNIPNDDTQSCHFCKLKFVVETFDTQINEPTNKISRKVTKVVKPTNKKTLL